MAPILSNVVDELLFGVNGGVRGVQRRPLNGETPGFHIDNGARFPRKHPDAVSNFRFGKKDRGAPLECKEAVVPDPADSQSPLNWTAVALSIVF